MSGTHEDNPYSPPEMFPTIVVGTGSIRKAKARSLQPHSFSIGVSFFVITLIIAWTALALVVQVRDRSWIALGVGVYLSPLVNLCLVFVGAVVEGLTLAATRKNAIAGPILWMIVAGLASTAITFFSMHVLELHGC